MHAATLNRVDLCMRDSDAGITPTLPQIMGIDGAGVVVGVDGDSTADTARNEVTRQSVDRHAALAMASSPALPPAAVRLRD